MRVILYIHTYMDGYVSVSVSECTKQRVVTGKLDVSCVSDTHISIVLTDFSSYTFIMNTCHMSHIPFFASADSLCLSALAVAVLVVVVVVVVILSSFLLNPFFPISRYHTILQFSFQFEFSLRFHFPILFIRSSSI